MTTTTSTLERPTSQRSTTPPGITTTTAPRSSGGGSSADATTEVITQTTAVECAAPTVALSGEPTSGTVPLPVDFTLSASTEACSTITSWSLDYGNAYSRGTTGVPPGEVSYTHGAEGYEAPEVYTPP